MLGVVLPVQLLTNSSISKSSFILYLSNFSTLLITTEQEI